MAEPRDLAERAERASPPPWADRERFAGYGVMGLPFASGHVLGMRRFPASSVGPGYTSVWHRDPDGAWTFYADQEPLMTCNRYFGSEVAAFERTPVDIEWTGPRAFSVRVASADLSWDVHLRSTAITSAMNTLGRLMPEPMWHSGIVLDVMGRAVGGLLRLGKITLRGEAPNKQKFVASPRLIWTIDKTKASVGGVDFGTPAPLAEQEFLGDFAIPQRGMFVVGRAFFEPFDASQHLSVASRAG